MNTISRLNRKTPYFDRNEAGEFLAQEIMLRLGPGAVSHSRRHKANAVSTLAGRAPTLVIGLCRGGVPVARTVARILQVPFDFLVVRKLSTQSNPELAIGALAECRQTERSPTKQDVDKRQPPARRLPTGADRKRDASVKPEINSCDHEAQTDFRPTSETNSTVMEVLNRDILAHLTDAEAALAGARDRETAELHRRVMLYRAGTAPRRLEGRRVILVDDGAATGATMKAAIASARKQGACEIIVALPVAPEEVCGELRKEADMVICPWTPAFFMSVGSHYTHFPQVEDEEIYEGAQRGV